MANDVCLIDGVPFFTGPDEVRWDFALKVVEQKTMGGKVLQILGTTLGDMTITGRIGRGDDNQDFWAQQDDLLEKVKGWLADSEGKDPTPVRFQYLPRNWDFQVFVKQVAQFQVRNDDPAPRWQLVLHIDQESAADIVTDLKDLYIKRLMEGVGWSQTDYNGPTGDVSQHLGGMTVGDYIAAQVQGAFDAGLQGGSLGQE